MRSIGLNTIEDSCTSSWEDRGFDNSMSVAWKGYMSQYHYFSFSWKGGIDFSELRDSEERYVTNSESWENNI